MSTTHHTRDHADVRVIAALLRGWAGAEPVKLGASLRRVREHMPPAEFRVWLEEDARVPLDTADQLMALAAAAPVDVLRPAELSLQA